MRRLVVMLLLGVVVSSVPSVASARRVSGAGNVVHTRRAPVMMHKMVPPFRGVHVYDKPGR